jgi:hypothetical protein
MTEVFPPLLNLTKRAHFKTSEALSPSIKRGCQ